MSEEEELPGPEVKPKTITFNPDEIEVSIGGGGGSDKECEMFRGGSGGGGTHYQGGVPPYREDEEGEEDSDLDGADALRMMQQPFERAARPSKEEVNSAYGAFHGSFSIPLRKQNQEAIEALTATPKQEGSWWQGHFNCRSAEPIRTDYKGTFAADGGPDFGVETFECHHCGDEFTEYDEEWVEEDGEKYCTITCLNLEVNG